MKIKFLPATYGDAIFLQWTGNNQPFHILIDGGTKSTFKAAILPELNAIIKKQERVNLVITTHIDYDHITGILELVKAIKKKELPANLVQKWWFNGGKLIDQYLKLPEDKQKEISLQEQNDEDNLQISLRQGVTLEQFLESSNHWHALPIHNEMSAYKIGNAKLTLLSPDIPTLEDLTKHWQKHLEKEANRQVANRQTDYHLSIEELARFPQRKDDSTFNASSIAFLLEYLGKRVLLLADAVPGIYLPALKKLITERGIDKLKVDLIKLSHHGSKYSFHPDLLNLVDCQHFVISTDASRFRLPNKSTLAKIVLQPKRDYSQTIYFYFNYDNEKLRSIFKVEQAQQLEQKYNFQCRFPSADWNGYEFNLNT